jgi:Flp pilus assembly protein TadD
MGILARLFSAPLGRRKRRAQERAATDARIRGVLDADGSEAAWAQLRAAALEDPESNALLRLAALLLRHDKELRLAELFDRAADTPHDPQRMLELGSALLTYEEPALASRMLSRALAMVPFDAVVRSELALAQARSGRPDEVLETLALHPCLAEDPGALFEFGWASMLVGDLQAARGILQELSPRHPLRDKLRLALERAATQRGETGALDARDFFFIEHGGLLLDDGGPHEGRYRELQLDQPFWGRTLGRLAHALQDRGLSRVIVLDDDHQALAERVAEAVGLPTAPRGKGRLPEGLLPVRDGVELASLGSQESRPQSGPTLFVVTLDPTTSAARAPDFIGAFACEARGAVPAASVALEAVDEGFRAYLDERREHLPPRVHRVRSAFVPDAPLPPMG